MTKKMNFRVFLSLVALVLSGLAIGLALVELNLRKIPKSRALTHNWAYHKLLGWSQIPNAQYDFTLKQQDSTSPVHVEFNSLGFRDVEHTLAKPANTKRIAFIGDSFCEAVQVNLSETFIKVLEKKLNSLGESKWEVLNFGVGDFGTAQEYIALKHYALQFSPDIVVHEIFPLNDICNNTIELFRLCKSNNDMYRPYFIESGDELKLTSAQPVRNFLRRNSVAFQVFEMEFWTVFGLYNRSKDTKFRNGLLQRQNLTGLEPLLYTYVKESEQVDQIRTGWRVTEKIIQKTAKLCASLEIPYLPLVIPYEGQLNRNWQTFSKQPPPEMHQAYPEQRLSRLFSALHIPSVILLNTFQEHEDVVLPTVDGHLNVAAHQIVANEIYKELVNSKSLNGE